MSSSSSHHQSFSPHTRGWTGCRREPGAYPRRFPRTRGDGPAFESGLGAYLSRFPRTRGDGPPPPVLNLVGYMFSPHTRGWTGPVCGWKKRGQVFPAHAGMDRHLDGARIPGAAFSPHTRGWTDITAGDYGKAQVFPAHAGMDRKHVCGGAINARVFPAHAGMDRCRGHAAADREGFPRTRGDGPTFRAETPYAQSFSPHTRGWTVSDR